MTTIVVDSPDRIAASFDIIDELTGEHGLVTSELVPALVSIDGERAPRRHRTGAPRLLTGVSTLSRRCFGRR